MMGSGIVNNRHHAKRRACRLTARTSTGLFYSQFPYSFYVLEVTISPCYEPLYYISRMFLYVRASEEGIFLTRVRPATAPSYIKS